MELYEEIELQECPICGGPAALEEENDWSFYVACLDCGAHTADIRYASGDTRRDAASAPRISGTSARCFPAIPATEAPPRPLRLSVLRRRTPQEKRPQDLSCGRLLCFLTSRNRRPSSRG